MEDVYTREMMMLFLGSLPQSAQSARALVCHTNAYTVHKQGRGAGGVLTLDMDAGRRNVC